MKLSAPLYQLKRQAKLLARAEKIALHRALDRVAQNEGFTSWSLLSAQSGAGPSWGEMLPRLSEGDLLLLAARPGQGKTLMGLQLLLDALRDGRRAVFFTLEYTQQQTRERMRSLSGQGDALEIVTSDDICAAYVVDYLAGAARGTVAVIDYLQILDQRRSKPALSEQIETLQNFARTTGIILAFISQIDRAYDPDRKSLPDIKDLRLPNQLDTGLFVKACFLQAGKIRFQAIA